MLDIVTLKMNWILCIWVFWALKFMCWGQSSMDQDYRLSISGYHLCTRNETRLVSYMVKHMVPYTVTQQCGGWIPWKTCQITKYRMTQYTDYKTVTEQVTRCCDGYIQIGQYCALSVNRSRDSTAKPGSCPTPDGFYGTKGCEWDIDCLGWQKCCQRLSCSYCTDPTSSDYSDNKSSRFNATVIVKVDFQDLMSREGGLLNHTRLLHAMVTGVLEPNVLIYYLSSQPVYPYQTATSLMIDCKFIPSLSNITSMLHHLLKHIPEVSSVTVEDIDECAQHFLHQCSPNTECRNTVGSYHCICLPGYADVDPTNPGTNCKAPVTYSPPTNTASIPATSTTGPRTSMTTNNTTYAPSQLTSTGPYSNVTSQPATTCPPPSISNLRSANVTGTSFRVYWSSLFPGNQSYSVVLSKGSEVLYPNNTSLAMVEIRGLQAGVLYNVTVTPHACGRQGNSSQLFVKTNAQILDATARLTNINYTNDLQNTTSAAYLTLNASINMEIYQSLSTEMRAMVDSGQVRIEITGFTPGSVVVTFSLIFTLSQAQDISNMSSALLTSLMNSSKYEVDKENTKIIDFDECASGQNDCSPVATCTNTQGSYNCTCKEGYEDYSPERPGRSCQAVVTTTSSPQTSISAFDAASMVTTPLTTTTITSATIPLTTTYIAPTTTSTIYVASTTTPLTTTTVPLTTSPLITTSVTSTNTSLPSTSLTTTTVAPTSTTSAITTIVPATTTSARTITVVPTTNTAALTTTTALTTITSASTTPIAPTTTASALTTTVAPSTTPSATTTTVALTSTTSATTTTVAPTTTTSATTTTVAPTTTTTATTTTVAPPITISATSTTTSATTTTVAPRNTTSASTTTVAPINTTSASTTTVAPTNTASASTTTVAPTTTASASTTTIAPTTTASASKTTVSPTTTVSASTTTVAPTTTVSTSTTTIAPTTTASASTTTIAPTTTASATKTTVSPTTTVSASTTTVAPTTTVSTSTTTVAPTTTVSASTTTTSALTKIIPTTTSVTATSMATSTSTTLTTSSAASSTSSLTTSTSTTTTKTSPLTTNITASDAIAVKCNVPAITVTVAKDFLQSIQINETALYLGMENCGVTRGNTTHVQLTVAWDKCNTLLVHNDNYYTASVTLFNSINTVEVTRTIMQIPIVCTYMKSMLITSNYGSMGFDMIKDVIMGSGMFQVTVQLMNGSVPLPHNFSLSPSEAVEVVVSLNTSVEMIKVVINKCWATPTPNPSLTYSYIFIENRCSVNAYTKVLMNGNSSTSSLSVQIFSFVDQRIIYLHCQVEVCVQTSSTTCVPDCLQRASRTANAAGTALGTAGPLLRLDDDSMQQGHDTLSIVGLSCLGVGLSIFFIIGFVCLFYYQRNRIGHYNFNNNKPKEENFTYLVFNT